jgi:tRNA(Arg) A34 adenosine deaminase TadA
VARDPEADLAEHVAPGHAEAFTEAAAAERRVVVEEQRQVIQRERHQREPTEQPAPHARGSCLRGIDG